MKKDFLRAVFTFVFLFRITVSSKAQTFPWAISGKGTNANLNEGYAVCIDPFNNIYVTGEYSSSNFAFGSYTLSSPGGVFLAKLDAMGNVLWAKKCSITTSTGFADAWSVSADQNGNPFITGAYTGSVVTFGTYTLTNSGNQDIFLAKYDVNGNLQWAKSAGGTGNETSCSVHADMNGNSFITGNFNSPTLAFGTTTLTNSGASDLFLTKYDPNGNVLWAKRAGNNYSDGGSSVSTDASGNVFVSGVFTSSTIAIGTITLTNSDNGGWRDQFLAKYDPSGNVLWAKNPIAPFHDSAWAVSVDPSGNAYVTGSYNNTTIVFGSYTVSMAPGSFNNMFIAKYDPSGNVLWAKGATGGYNGGYSVSSYSNGAYVSGFMYAGGNISFGTGTHTAPPGSTDPCFIVHYDATGNVGCVAILASGGDDNNSIAVDQSGNAYLAGDYVPTTFVVGSTTLTSVASGGEDVFVAKFNCSLTTGIDNAKESNNFKLFPNPNNGSFKLQINYEIIQGEIILFNSIGQYGFNDKEKDDEVKGSGNSYDFDERTYDPRLGRWLSIDPLNKKYPYLSPYNSFANNPIINVDKDGRENIGYIYDLRLMNPKLTNSERKEIIQEVQATAEKLNGYYKDHGINVQAAVLINVPAKTELDKSDVLVTVGSAEQHKTFDDLYSDRQITLPKGTDKPYKYDEIGPDVNNGPETTTGSRTPFGDAGDRVAVNTDILGDYASAHGVTTGEAEVLVIAHGTLSHTNKITHSDEAPASHEYATGEKGDITTSGPNQPTNRSGYLKMMNTVGPKLKEAQTRPGAHNNSKTPSVNVDKKYLPK
jgi:RHS repeat-associated protein